VQSFRYDELDIRIADLLRLSGGNSGLQDAKVLVWYAVRFGETFAPTTPSF
jgi:hypothetical protein